MDMGTATSIAAACALGLFIGGALVGWYIRGLGWHEPDLWRGPLDDPDPTDSAGA